MASYTYAVWRRKSSTATLQLYSGGTGKYTIVLWHKELPMHEFFGGAKEMYMNAIAPFLVIDKNAHKKYDAVITLKGGGMGGHTDAIRLAFARALTELNAENRLLLKPYGLLARDPRIKERKKAWLHKARKKPKRSKR